MPHRFTGIVAGTLLVLLMSFRVVYAAEPQARIKLTAWAPPSAVPREHVLVRVSSAPAPVLAVSAVPASRHLLLVVDPNSHAPAAIRRQLADFGLALSSAKPGTWTVRVGIPVLDGILGPPLSDPRKVPAEFDRIITSYLPETAPREPLSLGRTLDLVAGLIRNAEMESGSVDCLLLFRDRGHGGEDRDYLNKGMERLLASAALRAGSTLHGWLDGHGILQQACSRSGGLTWPAGTSPLLVLSRLAQDRGRALTVEVEIPRVQRSSALRLEVITAGGEGVRLRAPDTLWVHVDGSTPPDHRRMEQGLTWIRRATEARTDGNHTLARRFAESAVKEDSWNPEGYYLTTISALDLDDPAAACVASGDALNAVEPDNRLWLVYASACRRAGKASEALRRLRSEEGLPRSQALRLEAARLHAAAGEDETAKAIFEGMVDVVSKDAGLLADYGEVLGRLGLFEQSSRQLLAALDLDPRNSKAMILAARSFGEAGSPDKARFWATRAVESNPSNPAAHAALSAVLAETGQLGLAAESMQRAVLLAPDRRDLRDEYVRLLCHGGQELAAVAYLRRSLAANPDDTSIYETLGTIQERTGDLGEAARNYEKGAAHAPANGHELYRRAAGLRERRGEYGQALLDYRAMRRASPKNSSAQLPDELRSHLSAISLLVDGGNAEGNPFANEFRFERGPGRKELPRADDTDRSRMVVPGGLAFLGKLMGIEIVNPGGPDVIERVFAAILGSGAPKVRDNPMLRDALYGIRTYQAFVEYLSKEGLAPPDFDPARPQEIVFPLGGSDESLARTRRLLRFFKVDMKIRRSDVSTHVELIVKQGTSASARQRLLHHMGVNLMDQSLSELRLNLAAEEVPLIPGAHVWATRILAREGKKSHPLLERFLSDPRAMRLYLALAGCSKETRAALLQAHSPGALLQLVEPLAAYGRYLEFRDGELVFPGASESWRAFLGIPGPAPGAPVSALLNPDDWGALRVYASLARAPASVRQYLTATPERLRGFREIFSDHSRKRKKVESELAQPDLGRALAMMEADDQGLYLAVPGRLAGAILPDTPSGPNPSTASEVVRVGEKHLARFLEWACTLNARLTMSPLEGIALVGWLHQAHPGMIDQETAEAIVREPAATAAMLDIIIDLSPPAGTVRRYIAFARSQGSDDTKAWYANRMRTSQSLFHLLALLRRQGALSAEQGRTLLARCLDGMETASETAFARRVAEFVSGDLLPALAAVTPGPGADELILRALSGAGAARELMYQGRLLRIDASLHQLKRMRAAITHQNYMPLDRLLEGFRILAGREGTGLSVDALKNASALIQQTGSQPGSANFRGIARGDADRLANLMQAASGEKGAELRPLTEEIATALHVELGVTLLTYCYAYYGAPEVDAMAFDPNFVRKHDFSGTGAIRTGPWSIARVNRERGALHISGSLSGLGFELSRLETAQWSKMGETEEESLVSTLLTSMRSVPRSTRTERAQEYVALCVRLAHELLARAPLETGVRGWLEPYLESHILPRRLEQILEALDAGDPRLAARSLSPSELFLVGRTWVEKGAFSTERSAWSSPVFARLVSLTPANAEDRLSFTRELDQYGVPLRRKMGINQAAFIVAESYEQLETVGREAQLYERLCDLKIKLAELHYALGIPAAVAEVEGKLALRGILPETLSAATGTWRQILERIGRLTPQHAHGWMEELVAQGALASPGGDPDTKGGESAP